MTEKKTAEQFEQAKREFAEKWGYLTFDYVETNCSNECLSDLTSLLEQHKEVITADMYPKEFVDWLSYGSHPFVIWFDENGDYYTDEITSKRWSIDDLFEYWLKNVKK